MSVHRAQDRGGQRVGMGNFPNADSNPLRQLFQQIMVQTSWRGPSERQSTEEMRE